MAQNRTSLKAIFILFQALAVAIICFGSLINFHQYKIWGKPLIPNFIGYKRDVEKYSKTAAFIKTVKNSQQPQQPYQFSDGIISAVSVRCQAVSSSFSFVYVDPVGLFSRISPLSRRGPPVA